MLGRGGKENCKWERSHQHQGEFGKEQAVQFDWSRVHTWQDMVRHEAGSDLRDGSHESLSHVKILIFRVILSH